MTQTLTIHAAQAHESVTVRTKGERLEANKTTSDAAISSTRWDMAVLCCGARFTTQANRIILGVMMPFMMVDLKFTNREKGQVLAAFASGYMLTQVIGGTVADRIGAKGPLTVALLAVSLGSILAPFAADMGMKTLWSVYFLMGLLEGPSYPSIGSMLGKWFPSTEKGTASSVAGTGGSVGGLLAMGVGPIVADAIGWRYTLMLLGALSAGFTCVWMLRSADMPIRCARVSKGELQYLRQRRVSGAMLQDVQGTMKPAVAFPWRLFRFPPVLAVCYSHGVFNFGRYFIYGWMPTFYSKQLGVGPSTAAGCLTCLQIADTAIKLVLGPVADRFLTSGSLSLLGLRKVLSCVGFLGFGLALLACSFIKVSEDAAPETSASRSAWSFEVVAFTILLTIAKGCASLHTPGFQTNYLDLTLRDTGSVMGVGNTFATVASMVSPLITGYVIDQYSWGCMFQVVFLANLSGCIIFGIFASATNLDEEEEERKKTD